jgi:hypothetical protein
MEVYSMGEDNKTRRYEEVRYNTACVICTLMAPRKLVN